MTTEPTSDHHGEITYPRWAVYQMHSNAPDTISGVPYIHKLAGYPETEYTQAAEFYNTARTANTDPDAGFMLAHVTGPKDTPVAFFVGD